MANCIILSGGVSNAPDICSVQRSLGPYRLATALESAGYTTFVLDFVSEFITEEIIQALSFHLNEETLWVGFSSTFYWPSKKENLELKDVVMDKRSQAMLSTMYYTTEYEEVYKVIDYIKANSNAKLIFGGARAQYFLLDKSIDYYVLGYADNSVIDLTNFLAGKKDKIDFLREEINEGYTHLVIDSADYPEPDVKNVSTSWHRKDFNILPNEALPIELARGCIFKCKFCSYRLTGKKKGTYLRDIEQVRDEMLQAWESHGTDTYYFTDDTFNDDNDKLEDLHKLFTALPFKPKFSAYLRLDLINHNPHQADLLTEMGLIGTYFGIETLQPNSAKSIGKGLHPNKVKDRLYWLRERWIDKVNVEAGFILGLPHDTLEYFNELLLWTLEDDNPIQSIHYFPLYLFNYGKDHQLAEYSSEFSLNPEIYGYEFPENIAEWTLNSQKLTYRMCGDIARKFTDLRWPKNKIGGFHVITALNTGVTLEDIYKLTYEEIQQKYNIAALNKNRMTEYKHILGVLPLINTGIDLG